MRITVRTIYGAELQTAANLGLPYQTREDTTLNERFNIQPNTPVPTGSYPTVGYLGAGLGGHRLTAGAEGIPLNSPIPHRSTDANLYLPNPWVLRLQTEDLTETERAMFGMRRAEVRDGENYFAYYLLRIDYTDVVTKLNSTRVRDGQETTVPFIPNSSNLKPTAPSIVSDDAMPTLELADYVSVSTVIDINIDSWLANEYLNATRIIYGSDQYGIISEVNLVSGIDKLITAEGPGGVPIKFNEVIAAQSVSFMSDYNQITSSGDTIVLSFDVGTVEPLLTELTSGTQNAAISNINEV